MNMQATVGHKDVFLSYAHININFARRLKVSFVMVKVVNFTYFSHLCRFC